MSMADWFDLYMDLLSIAAVVIAPLSLLACVYAWWFVWRYSRRGRLPVISVVLAVVSSIAAPCALYIGALAFLRLRGEPAMSWTPPVSALVFLLLDFIPLIIMGYLVWLDRRPAHVSGEAPDREPPAPPK
jgi:hypothetical protein